MTYKFFGSFAGLFLGLAVVLAACTPRQEAIVPTSTLPSAVTAEPTALPTLTSGPTQEGAAASPSPSAEGSAVVAFIKEGNIHVWDEATGQTQTVVASGDVKAVSMSNDGQVIAFTRQAWIGDVLEGYEQHGLWAVDRNGGNERQLMAAESLRQHLSAGARDSTNLPQMEWIPGTHRLLFSGWKYIVQAEGESHATPQGLFLVDADSPAETVLVPVDNNLRFKASPDGSQIALLSPTGFGFINVDGSNWRQNVLTYPAVGLTAPFFPIGVWTLDSQAFLMTGSLERDPSFNFNFTIWRVPVDGSSPEALAGVTGSDPQSVAFSPDGQRTAFVQPIDQRYDAGEWMITPLARAVGPLAIPQKLEFEGAANLHWSPAGDAFTANLMKLCPEATRDTDVCDTRIHFSGSIAALHWIDGNRVLFLTREPSVLFLGRMDFSDNRDGTTIPVATWPVEEFVSPRHFTTAASVNQ